MTHTRNKADTPINNMMSALAEVIARECPDIAREARRIASERKAKQ